jgi:hypothetical protein
MRKSEMQPAHLTKSGTGLRAVMAFIWKLVQPDLNAGSGKPIQTEKKVGWRWVVTPQ